MKENIIKEKSFAFALRIIRVYKFLTEQKHEHVLSKQVLRSGTSIGANIEEAIGGQSRKDFSAKMGIAYREARETKYWLELLFASKYLNVKEYDSIIYDNEEILKLLGSIQKTTNEKIIRNS